MTALRVLIIDDDIDFADGIADVVELLGHEAETANSGEEGLARAIASRFDVALVDVGLPGRSGVEFVRELKEAHAELKCALMSGYSVDWLHKTGTSEIDVPVLTKPVTLEHISDLLSS